MTLGALGDLGDRVPRFAVASRAFEALPPRAAVDFVAHLERAGIGQVWFGEVLGREAFTIAHAALAGTRSIIVGTGVARALERVPKNAAAASAFLSEASGGRYVLGLGVSGASRERGSGPLPFMSHYLDDLDQHHARTGTVASPRILGAYSAGITALARDRANGLLTFMVTPEHTRWARSVLGPEPFLSVSHRVIFSSDVMQNRAIARDRVAYYLGLPHQRAKLARLGFTESDLEHGGSDRLIGAMFAWGDTDEIARTLGAHLEAGADQITVGHEQPPTPEVVGRLRDLQSALGLTPT